MRYYKMWYDAERGESKYVFCFPHHEDEDYIDNEMDRYMVEQGIKISDWNDKLRFQYDKADGKILSDYLCNVYSWLMVSKKFKQLSEPLIGNVVQYLPITIIDKNTQKIDYSYSVANILTRIKALDVSQSDCFTIGEGDNKILSVIRPVLLGERIQGNHIFRLKENWTAIYVSNEIKKMVTSNHLLGFKFSEVKIV